MVCRVWDVMRRMERQMNKLWTMVMTLGLLSGLALTPTLAGAASEYNAEGKYKRIAPARPLEQTDKVEVVDVFWYGCPHCFTFLPHLQQWEESTMPEYVELRRVPAIFRDSWAVHARAYYTARVLNKDSQLHTELFKAMHDEKRSLNTQQELRIFFSEHGVNAAEFDSTYDSFTVDSMTRQSQVMPKRWGVQGTPSVIVNGRYLVSGRTAGSYEDMIKVIEVLVEREHQAMAERAQAGQ